MSAVRCSWCGALVFRADYATHIPCRGAASVAQAGPSEAVGWGSLLLPPGHPQRGDQDDAQADASSDPALTPPPPGGAPHRAPRLDTARGRVLHLLDDLQWHRSQAITDPAVGGSEGLRRVRELRAAGHVIEKRRVSAGVYEYQLARRCTCRCPDGPCTHDWSGGWRDHPDGHGGEVTCSRCGAGRMAHDLLALP